MNKEFGLPDGSYSISDIQDYSEHILKKHRGKTVNPSIRTYKNKIENGIVIENKVRILSWTFNYWNNEITCKQ